MFHVLIAVWLFAVFQFHVYGLNEFDQRYFENRSYNPFMYYGSKLSLTPQSPLLELNDKQSYEDSIAVIGDQRVIRDDPSWRHIGLGKRFEMKTRSGASRSADEQRTWAMIGLGRRRK